MDQLHNDIEKYLRGELSAAEMHALEQKALRDPFLAEALEGAEHAGADSFSVDIEMLKQSVTEKAGRRQPRMISISGGWGMYMAIAASLLLLVISSFVVLSILRQKGQESQIAKNETTVQVPAREELKDEPATTEAPEEKPATDGSTSDAKEEKETAPAPEVNEPEASTGGGELALEDGDGEQRALPEPEKVVEADLQPPPVISQDITGTERAKASKKAEVSEASKKAEVSGAADRAETRAFVLPGERRVHGVITSADDKTGLPGVNVVIKGTNVGTVTDAQGHYDLLVPVGSEALVVSFIGLTSEEVDISGRSEVNVEMESDVSQLSEVVVTGYSASEADDNEFPVLEMATPEGGRKAFKKYLEDQMKYPRQALDNKVEGRVTVQFVVEPNGKLTDFKVLKGLGYGCDEEVIRLIKEGPSWSPSKRDNRPVRDEVKIRLRFELPDKK